MRYFDKTQLEALKRWESNFHSAVYSNYSRPLGKNEIDFMRSLYFEAQGDDIFVNLSCGKCVLDFLKRIGKWYYDSIGKEGVKIEESRTEHAKRISRNVKANKAIRDSKKNAI